MQILNVFVCYLDDSGKDPHSPNLTLAGYMAREAAWSLLEVNVEPVIKEFGVAVLHARDLHCTDGNFADWRQIKKQEFVSRLCTAMTPHLSCGLSMSVLKEPFKARRAESRARGVEKYTPYNFCFHAILDWLTRQAEIQAEGVSLILERGHENNPEVRNFFQTCKPDLQTRGPLGNNLLSS